VSKASYKQRNASRRAATIERNKALRVRRSPQEQLRALDAAGHRAEKERAKLQRVIGGSK